MTTFTGVWRVYTPRTRRARREVVANAFGPHRATASIKVPWLVITLGIALTALTLVNLTLILVDLA